MGLFGNATTQFVVSCTESPCRQYGSLRRLCVCVSLSVSLSLSQQLTLCCGAHVGESVLIALTITVDCLVGLREGGQICTFYIPAHIK